MAKLKDAYYFPHFCNARHDRKIKRVIKELGIEGYGIFFMLLEVLREQTDLKYPMDDIDLLADEFGTSEPKVRTVICNYQLFDVDEKQKFFSPKLLMYLQPYFSMREQRKIAGKKSGESRRLKALNNGAVNECSTDVQRELNENEQSKVNKNKVNKSKVNNYYLNNVNPTASPLEIEKLNDWMNDLPEDVVCLAIERAVEQRKRNMAYIDAILRNWLKEGLTTVEAIAFKEMERKNKPNQPRGMAQLEAMMRGETVDD